VPERALEARSPAGGAAAGTVRGVRIERRSACRAGEWGRGRRRPGHSYRRWGSTPLP